MSDIDLEDTRKEYVTFPRHEHTLDDTILRNDRTI